MKKNSESIRLHLDEPLRKSRKQGTSMSLPLAIHHRLDELARLADIMETSRAELIGMLIAEADLDAEQLELKILKYRRMTVADALPPEALVESSSESADNVIELATRGPGRPSSASG